MKPKKQPNGAKKVPKPADKWAHKWVIMKLHKWDSLTVWGIPTSTPKEGPHGFIPVFDTREQAVAFNSGSEANIHAIAPSP